MRLRHKRLVKAIWATSGTVLFVCGMSLESSHANMAFVIGLIAGVFGLIVGALYNAEIERQEDIEFRRRLRREEERWNGSLR